MENSLPKGWSETTLGAIADWASGGTPKSTESKYYGGDIPWLIIGDLNDSYITKSQKTITRLGLENSSAKIAPIGSVLCAMYGSIGKLGITSMPCATNQAIAFTERIHGGIPNKFLFYYLFSQKQNLLDIGKGGAQQNISQTVLKQISIPLPPVPEQQRIVAKLDELMAKIERSRARLERIPQILKRFRQSVLSAAVSGKLTEEWRERNKAIADAEVFLLNIEQIRRENFENASLMYAGKKGKKPKGSISDFRPLVKIDSDYPNSWRVTRVMDIVDCLDSIRKPINKEERAKRLGDIPYYGANGQVGWIDDYLFDEDLVVVVEDETFIGREIPFSYIIRGKTWVNNHAHVLRPNAGMSVEYLNICLSYYDFTPLTSGTTGRRKLTQGALMDAELAIAPLAEQNQIVLRVNQLLSIADKIEARYNKAKAQLDKLPQSLLAKAFRGELVPQDENDEPASVLLERIHQVNPAKQPGKVRKPRGYKMGVEPLSMAAEQ